MTTYADFCRETRRTAWWQSSADAARPTAEQNRALAQMYRGQQKPGARKKAAATSAAKPRVKKAASAAQPRPKKPAPPATAASKPAARAIVGAKGKGKGGRKYASLQAEIVDLFKEDGQPYQAADVMCRARGQNPNENVLALAEMLGVLREPKVTLCRRLEDDINAPGLASRLKYAAGALFHHLGAMVHVGSAVALMRRRVKALLSLPVLLNATSRTPPKDAELGASPRLYATLQLEVAGVRHNLDVMQRTLHAIVTGASFTGDLLSGRTPRLPPRLVARASGRTLDEAVRLDRIVSGCLTALAELNRRLDANPAVRSELKDIKAEQARERERVLEQARRAQEMRQHDAKMTQDKAYQKRRLELEEIKLFGAKAA